MPKHIHDRVVVITGASSGIGRATAERLAAEGATVVLAARREEALRDVAQVCTGRGARAHVMPVDVTDAGAVEDLAAQTVQRFGRIDVWVNNAAVTLFGRFEETPLRDFERVIQTNLMGYVHGARAALPRFREQGAGVLINVSSVVGTIGQAYASAYVSSKWAIRGLSECLRMELADAPGISVCTVLPASIDTPIFQHGANYTGRAVQAMPPVHPAADVAAAIVELASRPRREVFIGASRILLEAGHGLAPGLIERTMAHRVETTHFQDHRPAPHGSGNLFEPTRESSSISGGWVEFHRQSRGQASAPTLFSGALTLLTLPLMLIALAAGGLCARQQRRTEEERHS